LWQSGHELYIGQDSRDQNYWDGYIDDLRIYDKELSNTEVSNLYNTGIIDG